MFNSAEYRRSPSWYIVSTVCLGVAMIIGAIFALNARDFPALMWVLFVGNGLEILLYLFKFLSERR